MKTPIAVIIAGALVAGSILWVGHYRVTDNATWQINLLTGAARACYAAANSKGNFTRCDDIGTATTVPSRP
jgi:hypothetical protein